MRKCVAHDLLELDFLDAWKIPLLCSRRFTFMSRQKLGTFLASDIFWRTPNFCFSHPTSLCKGARSISFNPLIASPIGRSKNKPKFFFHPQRNTSTNEPIRESPVSSTHRAEYKHMHAYAPSTFPRIFLNKFCSNNHRFHFLIVWSSSRTRSWRYPRH
jgi:hypothetical protein